MNGKLYWIVLGVLFFGVLCMGRAQSTRDVTTQQAPAPRYLNKKKEKKFLFLFKKKQRFNRITGEEESDAFDRRMKKAAREKWKIEKKMAKPQYSDPSYFGHKHPPKKRKPGKKKFCKECGMVH